uniref:Uncharacterized protein n=1 Tax=Manihot esculenta TaxID=3983 RepID=A0A2C9VEV8_MANES
MCFHSSIGFQTCNTMRCKYFVLECLTILAKACVCSLGVEWLQFN